VATDRESSALNLELESEVALPDLSKSPSNDNPLTVQ
jgi:hypothetical protein